MVKKWLPDLLAIISIILLTAAFFARLFYPQLSIFATPEFGSSDIWHYNYPIKFLFAQGLKAGTIPLWSSGMGGGFPIFAEGQHGIFNFYNLIAFWTLPPLVAFNLGYVLSFATATVGMYVFVRMQKISVLPSLIGAISFGFSGFFIGHVQHYNLIQTASLFPWILTSGVVLSKKPSVILWCCAVLLISQQLLSGFVQLAFISLLCVFLYLIFCLVTQTARMRHIILWLLAVTTALILSAVQLLPTLEFTRVSSRKTGITPSELFRYTYPLNHLHQFANPFALGKPTDATYPYTNPTGGPIFWETNGYVGILPLILLPLSIFLYKNRLVQFSWLLLGSGFLFMVGAQGPFSVILTTPPFSFFRNNSRFIFWTTFALAILTAHSLQKVKVLLQKKPLMTTMLGFLLLFFHIINTVVVWWSYHPVVTSQAFHEKPATLVTIPPQSRVYSLLRGVFWHENYRARPFTPGPYLYFRNELSPNMQLLWGIGSVTAYAGFDPLRKSLFDGLLSGAGAIATRSAEAQKALTYLVRLKGGTHLISPFPLQKSGEITLTTTVQPPTVTLPPYFVYALTTPLPNFFTVSDMNIVRTTQELLDSVGNLDFDPRQQVLVESEIPFTPSGATSDSVEITNQSISDQRLTITVTTKQEAILVRNESFYPGWRAFIDGTETTIYPANLTMQAIVLPQGKHTVSFVYEPNSFRNGLLISGIGYGVIILAMAAVSVRTFYSRRGKTRQSRDHLNISRKGALPH